MEVLLTSIVFFVFFLIVHIIEQLRIKKLEKELFHTEKYFDYNENNLDGRTYDNPINNEHIT